jgi:hypothetical protein
MMAELDDETVEVNGKRIAVGHYIKVRRTPGNKTSFIGKIKGWWIKDGEVVTIDVWGGSPKGAEKMRSLRIDQVEVLSPWKQRQLQSTKDES